MDSVKIHNENGVESEQIKIVENELVTMLVLL